MLILISPFLGGNVKARLFDSVYVGLVHPLYGSAPIAIHPAEVPCAPPVLCCDFLQALYVILDQDLETQRFEIFTYFTTCNGTQQHHPRFLARWFQAPIQNSLKCICILPTAEVDECNLTPVISRKP